jgi:predicted nucleic acid-binding protein
MIGVLPDSSIWIAFFDSKTSSPEKTLLTTMLETKKRIYTCPTVFQEVLQGVREEKDFIKTKKKLSKCLHGKIGINQATDKAIEIYRTLRKKGFTIRKPNDCLIAAYALLNNVGVLYTDRDFDPIVKEFGLQMVV